MAVLWTCDFCGGPANWNFVRGEAYFHCQALCDGFNQLDLDLGDIPSLLDKVVSVRAVDEDEDPAGSSTDKCSDQELPF